MRDTEGGDRETAYATLLTDPRLGLVIGFAFVGIFGTSIASPVLPGIASELAVSDARIGLVMTAFFLPAIVFVPLAGLLADVYGRRPVVLASLALFGLGGTAIAFVEPVAGRGAIPLAPFDLLLVLRTVQGVGFAGLTPLSVTLVGDLYEGPTASAAQGLRVSTNSVAGMLSPPLAGLLAGLAWTYPFLLYALAFPLLIAAWVWLPETAANGGRSEQALATELREYWRSFRAEVDDRDLALLLLRGFALYAVKTAIRTYIPLFAVRSLGASALLGGAMLSVRGAVRIVAAPTTGRLVEASTPKRVLLGSTLLAAAGTALVPLSPSIPWLVVAVTVYSVADALFSTVLNDAVASRASPEHRGGVVSGLNSLKNVANTASPAVFGILLALGGFDLLFWGAAAVGVLYVLVAAPLLGSLVGE
ncbi:MAG: MFS transporter [Haloferacaceae archaeon]